MKFNVTPELQPLLDTLKAAGDRPRFVGGMVRDAILNLPISDIDIATTFTPDKVTETLTKASIKCIDTGSKFGTITAIIGKQHAEITTLRIDLECDGRHTKAIFTDSFELDARRRDFTINAMSYCPYEQKLYDYVNGQEDLQEGRVRFIGVPQERIEEDHLRILRFFRFHGRFGKSLDEASLSACITNKNLINKLSKERVLSELTKMIAFSNAAEIFEIMIQNQIMHEIMPEAIFDCELLSKINSNNLNLRFAALLHKCQLKILKIILKDLRFSNVGSKEIMDLVEFKQSAYGIVRKSDMELKELFYPLWLAGKDVESYGLIASASENLHFANINMTMNKPPPKCPVDGDDMLQIGITPKDIGAALLRLKQHWIRSDLSLSKNELLERINPQ